jgi:hypothetical protein
MKPKLPVWHRYAKKWMIAAMIGMQLIAAIHLSAQQIGPKKITYSATQVKAEVILRAIEQQTTSSLTYNRDEMNAIVVPTVDWKDKPLADALKELQQKYGITYSLLGNNIALKAGPKPAAVAKKEIKTGRVTGKVLDEELGQPIMDATVRVGSKSTTSAVDGSFNLSLPAGSYTGSVSYVGYTTKEITDIRVTEEQDLTLNVVLKRQKGQLAGVVVRGTARRESVASLYARQKNSASISDGISQEQIAKTPDKNIGESLKRISGLATVDNRYVVVRGLSERYNGAVLNGQLMPSTELNRKQFSFDIVPANMVEQVVVTKTLTPDKSAEFGGGLIEVNMLDIPARNFFSVSAGTSFNDRTTGKHFLSLPLEGKEYRGKVASHRYAMGRLDWTNPQDIIDAFDAKGKSPGLISNNWGLTRMKAPVSQNYQLSIGQVLGEKDGRRWGLMAAGNYRNSFLRQQIRSGRESWGPPLGAAVLAENAMGTAYGMTTNLSGLFGVGYQTRRTKISLHSLLLRTYDQQLNIIDSGVHQQGNWGYYDITTQTTLWQTTLKGEHALGTRGIRLNWSAGYTDLNKLRPDNHQAITTAIVQPGEPNNINVLNLSSTGISTGALRWWTRVQEKNYNWDLSLSLPFTLGNSSQSFKGGYGGWNKDRLFYVLLSGSGGNGNDYPIPLRELYTPEYNYQFDFSRQFGDAYQVSLPLHAVYGMFDNRWAEKWRLVWGLRAESYDIGRASQVIDKMEQDWGLDYSALRNREKTWQVFPSANLTYALSSSMNLRLAYSKSIIRPDLRELSYFKEYDFELGGSYQGGPVRSTVLHHYDFRYEWYPAAGDIVSASLFFKQLDYPMSIYLNQGSGSFFLANDKVARNYGFEVEARKSLAFTGVPVIENMTLYGNFTYLDSRVRRMELKYDLTDPDRPVPEEEVYDWEKRPQTGASNFMYNAGAYFDNKKIAASIVYNVVTNRLFRPSEKLVESLYEQSLNALDAQLAVRFFKQRFEVKLNASNLLNGFSVVYANGGIDDNDIIMGKKAMSKQQSRYQEAHDYVNFKNWPGRTYAVTLTYSIK